jgi:bifunctional DNA-binding transcriptional regulator/antitoxin component of YhaV-PrlF toxin-antitoxin module
MSEKFRLKVAARRQVTIPGRLLELLQLGEGDILEIEVEGNAIRGTALKLVPATLFTPDIVEVLKRREVEMGTGQGSEAKDTKELLARMSKKSKTEAIAQ